MVTCQFRGHCGAESREGATRHFGPIRWGRSRPAPLRAPPRPRIQDAPLGLSVGLGASPGGRPVGRAGRPARLAAPAARVALLDGLAGRAGRRASRLDSLAARHFPACRLAGSRLAARLLRWRAGSYAASPGPPDAENSLQPEVVLGGRKGSLGGRFQKGGFLSRRPEGFLSRQPLRLRADLAEDARRGKQ